MVSFKSLFVVTFVTVFSVPKQTCCLKQNASALSSERSGRQSSVNVDTSVNSPSSHSISPSFSYEFHTNDHEHLDQIVSSHHNVVANSFNSDDATNAQNQDSIISSASTNQARISSGTKSAPTYYYPTVDSYQQQENSDNAQQSRIWEKKEQALKQSQPNPDSAPEAFSDQKYTSQAVQVGNSAAAAAPVPSIPITATERSSSYQNQPGKQSTDPNLIWNPIAKESNLTASSAYSRPPKNQQRSDGSPATYQRRHSLQYTAPRYTNVVPQQPAAGASSKRSLSTKPEAYKPISKLNRRKILQSRADTYAHDEDGDADEQSENGGEEENHEDDNEQDTNNDEYYSQYNNVYDPDSPQLKELGFPPGGGFGSPFTGPGGPLDGGPLPPPPPALKGSIDYILIPLILIGLAGPIFVVLYVILGAFEARISPIQRSLSSGYSDYKPYIDNLTSSVGRALEQYECFDYAVCRFGGISSSLGLSRSTSAAIESALTSATPKEYVPTLRRLFSIMETPRGDCKKYKCSAIADQFPVNF